MQSVISSSDSVKEYMAGFAQVLASASRECPYCGRHLKGHGRRHRWVVSLEGVFRIPIQRMICTACRKTFSLLPKMLYAFSSCTRSLAVRIKSLWVRGVRKMAAVRYLLSTKPPFLELPFSSLYRWAGHTA